MGTNEKKHLIKETKEKSIEKKNQFKQEEYVYYFCFERRKFLHCPKYSAPFIIIFLNAKTKTYITNFIKQKNNIGQN